MMASLEAEQEILNLISQELSKNLHEHKHKDLIIETIIQKLHWTRSRGAQLRLLWSDDFTSLIRTILELELENMEELRHLKEYIEGQFSHKILKNNMKFNQLLSKDGMVPLELMLKHKSVIKYGGDLARMIQSLKDSEVLTVVNESVKINPSNRPMLLASTNLDTSNAFIKHMRSSGPPIREAFPVFNLDLQAEPSCISCNSNLICVVVAGEVLKINIQNQECNTIPEIKNIGTIVLQKQGTLLAAVQDNTKLLIIDTEKESILEEFDYESPRMKVYWGKFGENLIGIEESDGVIVSDLANEHPLEFSREFVILEDPIIDFDIFTPTKVLAVAIDTGLIQVISIESGSTLYSYAPHHYNTNFYSSLITVSFLDEQVILTSGKSQSELTVWNWQTAQQVHNIELQPLNTYAISLDSSGLVLNDKKNTYAVFVELELVEEEFKFTTLFEYNLTASDLIHLSNKSFVTVNECVLSFFRSEDDSKKILPELSLNTDVDIKVKMIESIAEHKINTLKIKLNSKNGDKKKNGKNPFIQGITDTIKQTVNSLISPAIVSALNEVMSQAVAFIESSVTAYSEKSDSLQRELEIINADNDSKLKNFEGIVNFLFENFEEDVRDKFDPLENELKTLLDEQGIENHYDLQDHVNNLLAQELYDRAIITVIKQPYKLYNVLKLLNPVPLLTGNKLSSRTVLGLLKQMMIFPPSDDQLPDLQLWMANLCATCAFSSTDLEVLRPLLNDYNKNLPGFDLLEHKLS